MGVEHDFHAVCWLAFIRPLRDAAAPLDRLCGAGERGNEQPGPVFGRNGDARESSRRLQFRSAQLCGLQLLT